MCTQSIRICLLENITVSIHFEIVKAIFFTSIKPLSIETITLITTQTHKAKPCRQPRKYFSTGAYMCVWVGGGGGGRPRKIAASNGRHNRQKVPGQRQAPRKTTAPCQGISMSESTRHAPRPAPLCVLLESGYTFIWWKTFRVADRLLEWPR
jgi:hypothetical protein